MIALSCFGQNFLRWVQRGHADPLPLIPVESWAERKANYDRAKRAHHGQADAYWHLRKATHEALRREVRTITPAEASAAMALLRSHPHLFSATARQFVEELR